MYNIHICVTFYFVIESLYCKYAEMFLEISNRKVKDCSENGITRTYIWPQTSMKEVCWIQCEVLLYIIWNALD